MSIEIYTSDGLKAVFDDRTKYRVLPGGVLETVDVGVTLWSPTYWLKVDATVGHGESEA